DSFLYDLEVNEFISAIAACTSDLTIVLDSCHSAGATRDVLSDDTRVRVFQGDSTGAPVAPPASLAHHSVLPGTPLLQSLDPEYVVVCACQADEKALENSLNGRRNGLLTRALVNILKPAPSESRPTLRWADIWPGLVDQLTNSSSQHPWLIGRSERRI